MKNNLKKLVLATLLASTPMLAESNPYKFDTYSLMGIEGGYSTFDIENNDNPPVRKSPNFGYGAVKIGAQTQSYRMFISARQFSIKGFDYAKSYGLELQYLFDFSKYADLYLGVNTGKISMRFIDANNQTRSTRDTYFGGDIGLNVHAGESVDLEFGLKTMNLSASDTQAGITYTFDNITSAYMSIIFKYQMD